MASQFPESTRRMLYHRSGDRCEMCGITRKTNLHISHRIARGMGGTTREQWANLSRYMLICGRCHSLVENHPREAAKYGWKSPRFAPAWTVPCWTWRGWVFLTKDGRYTWPPLSPEFT